ncbi:N-(5'-phosphoribosyl)anthranilate isomerase [Spirochaetia bacterium]|nr:N-(5'-phosphoribosyl)anthranilate isomerase [Spirochaetia bacterium]GHT74598.1 N-(5'-phosphoribosyl)anthranilate isomerase [Spirochaetia bacterium]
MGVKIKLCGLFRDEDIDFANEARPDYIGFVFAKSRRQVTAVQAARMRARLREGIVPVGVFVNAPVEEVAALYRDGVIGVAQLHGAEDWDYIAALKERCNVPVIKAVKVKRQIDLTPMEHKSNSATGADFLLLDNGPGGTGRRFDWALLQDGDYLNTLSIPCFLAGGIDVSNIGEALRFRPYGIDVSSGAETDGVKDRDKMIRLVEIVRSMV